MTTEEIALLIGFGLAIFIGAAWWQGRKLRLGSLPPSDLPSESTTGPTSMEPTMEEEMIAGLDQVKRSIRRKYEGELSQLHSVLEDAKSRMENANNQAQALGLKEALGSLILRTGYWHLVHYGKLTMEPVPDFSLVAASYDAGELRQSTTSRTFFYRGRQFRLLTQVGEFMPSLDCRFGSVALDVLIDDASIAVFAADTFEVHDTNTSWWQVGQVTLLELGDWIVDIVALDEQLKMQQNLNYARAQADQAANRALRLK